MTSNIDTFQMAGLPNPKNSELLGNLCVKHQLTDPFRVLYPIKREFTYSPFGHVRLNRSRLDFFVVSETLIPDIGDCSISSSTKCKLFDHKQVNLYLNPSKRENKPKSSLSNSYLTETLLRASVEVETRRLHIFSFELNNENPIVGYGTVQGIKEQELEKIRLCKNAINLVVKMREAAALGNCSRPQLMEIEGRERDIEIQLIDMIPLTILERIPKCCPPSVFFELLVDVTKKAGVRMQKTLSRIKGIGVLHLENTLSELKISYNTNINLITETENKLRAIRDNELRDKLRDTKIFEYLNAERATPLLLNLAKKKNKAETLETITADNGDKLHNTCTRGEYIRNFYSTLFEKDCSVTGEIEDFLGNDICNHPLVWESKLKENEVTELDRPLSIEELDKALEKANIKSAPGVDGFSYRFIRTFWDIYRYPLFTVATDGLENNTLPGFFKTAIIKLIPKKGDTTKIKNWRPISLLSNFYKIISRLINTRLQKIVDRVMSRAQKGFTKSRQIQEVIINVMETMDFCNKNGIKGALVSFDQAKAFDSVSHDYMIKVYKFFGFGERITRWLCSIGTGRTAAVLLDSETVTPSFTLGRGHAQGDSPLPVLYNIAAQILIFKLELDPQLKKIRNEPFIIPAEHVPPLYYKNEGFGQTTINESFADDSSNLILLDLASLSQLKNILSDFRTLSGLSCNLEKSFVMRIGNLNGEISNKILELGFTFSDRITLLGFTLQIYGDTSAANFEKVLEKVENLTRFWERFHLSICGKIAIYKSLLLSQINYIASIFAPPDHVVERLNNTMETFVAGGLNIGKAKLYMLISEGGLGMLNLRDFIMALQCSWIKRCHGAIIDNWRAQMITIGNGSITDIVNDSHSRNALGTVLQNILVSYDSFKCSFTKVDNNYLKVPIYCNNAFGFGRGNMNRLDEEFFGIGNDMEKRKKIMVLTWEKLTSQGALKTIDMINLELDIAFTNEQHAGLKNAYKSAVGRYRKVDADSQTIGGFLGRFRKGSKPFRNIVAKANVKQNLSLLPHIKTFLRLIDCGPPSDVRIKSLFCSWNKTVFSSRINLFKFKYYNNILGTNNRVSHFNREINAGCTFCNISGPRPIPAESFSHIFYDCPVVNGLIFELEKKYLVGNSLTKEKYFISNFAENEKDNIACNILLDGFRYLIWQ